MAPSLVSTSPVASSKVDREIKATAVASLAIINGSTIPELETPSTEGVRPRSRTNYQLEDHPIDSPRELRVSCVAIENKLRF
jgi:hypothetical protein